MLPRPTADPMAAKMKTLREEKPSLGLTSGACVLDMLTLLVVAENPSMFQYPRRMWSTPRRVFARSGR